MDVNILLRKVGNHWYPCINHNNGYMVGLDPKLDRYLNILDQYKREELTLYLYEIGEIWPDNDFIQFNEADMVRYLTTDDYFKLRFTFNGHEFTMDSNLYWLLENNYNLNFHKTWYCVSIF